MSNQIATAVQIAASWMVIMAETYIPWPLSFLIAIVLLMALVPTIIEQTLRIRALRKHRA